MSSARRMPAIFFGHGNPMYALQENRYTETWRALGAALPKPKAILAVSAHWVTHGTAVTAMPEPRTIHDFGRFPQALFDIGYPAAGDPGVADRVRTVLAPLDVRMDYSWGLDHGTWSVLVKAFPGADVPVLQLSIAAGQPPAYHADLGRRLSVLRDEGILIMGTGNVVHNLRTMVWSEDAPPHDWALRFNQRMRAALEKNDGTELLDYASWPDAAHAVPTPEHLEPLFYVIGSKREDDAISIAVDGVENGSISMLTAVVGKV